MVSVVQTKSRKNRTKLFKKYYWHSTPNFRCYHGSRLPPRATMEGFWPHSKFFSKDITWGKPVKEKKRAPKLLSKKLKAQPAKRKKRGPLSKTELGKKKATIKKIKPRKRVTFAKSKAYHQRQEQDVKEYGAPRDIRGDPRYSRKAREARRYGDAAILPKVLGSRGDPAKRVFRRDAAGNLVAVAAPKRKLRLV